MAVPTWRCRECRGEVLVSVRPALRDGRDLSVRYRAAAMSEGADIHPDEPMAYVMVGCRCIEVEFPLVARNAPVGEQDFPARWAPREGHDE